MKSTKHCVKIINTHLVENYKLKPNLINVLLFTGKFLFQNSILTVCLALLDPPALLPARCTLCYKSI